MGAEVTPWVKMSSLIEDDYHLLALLMRMGITESFGERTVDDLCSRAGLDTETFIQICRTFCDSEYRAPAQVLRRCRVDDIIRYLHHSHEYYLNTALVSLHSLLEELVAPAPNALKRVIRKFFEDYRDDLQNHFDYEENMLIPYLLDLLRGVGGHQSSSLRLLEGHPHMKASLSDLKSLIMNSLPAACDSVSRISTLMFIFELEEDVERHTRIEDRMLVPIIRLIENPRTPSAADAQDGEDDLSRGELSDREKEILVGVAKGLLNKEIADEYNISINTVITHRKNITRKTGIKTVSGLTVYAILNNLIDINSIE